MCNVIPTLLDIILWIGIPVLKSDPEKIDRVCVCGYALGVVIPIPNRCMSIVVWTYKRRFIYVIYAITGRIDVVDAN